MKELFTGFLSVSLSGGLIICLVLVLRVLFYKAPKALICVLWALAIIRLLLPFQIETTFSIRPDTPVFSVSAPGTVEQNVGQMVEITNNTLSIPMVRETEESVDLWQMCSWVWVAGVAVMLLYTLISYLKLKQRLAKAVPLENGVFASERLDSAILLGYFNPRIYLPATINDTDAELVIAHERAHLRRGDNWLKLLGFISLAFHWFNPLVWIAYLLMCRDVEDACDQQVIGKLDTEGKKRYSTALLSCGSQKRNISVCPVAFGEISVRQRIKNVLSYRKPTLWICVFAMVGIAIAAVFFMTDPVQKHPPYFETMSSMIGKSVDEVCRALDISEDELETYGERSYVHDTPVYVSYQGMTFRLRFYSYEYTDEYRAVTSFDYYALYDPKDPRLEEDLVKFSRRLWKSFGQSDPSINRKEPELLSYVSKKTIRRLVDSNVEEGARTGILSEFWDVTDDLSTNSKKSVEALFAYEQNNITITSNLPTTGYETPMTVTDYPVLFLNFEVIYGLVQDHDGSNSDKISVRLEYKIRSRKEQIPTFVAAYIEEQNWWDKFLNWLK